ncbi:MASE1 domain-containing protein [Streptomyces sp. NPDC051776]|uniref:MASE1 domain-containing protein n=1 Tax=Streptomyces sp. NPDC051776 TaxID=3155414 RepID=UPI00342A2613
MNGVLLNLAVTGGYYASGEAGLEQELVRGQITPLWPPTGIAVACLLLFGRRVWPGIALGAFLVNVPLGPSGWVFAIVLGNTIAPLVSYALLRRADFRTELDRLRDALALVFLGALLAMLVSSTVGTGALVLAGALDADEFWPAWSVWWTGDAMGVLVVVPVLLALRAAWPGRRILTAPAWRWAEAAALLICTGLVALGSLHSTLNMLFVIFPFLIWAAYRFQLPGAAPCVLIISVLAIFAAGSASGPFHGHDLFAQMFTLQALNGSAALTALVLSAMVTERNETRERIEAVCAQLAEVVVRLAPGERGAPERRWDEGDDTKGEGDGGKAEGDDAKGEGDDAKGEGDGGSDAGRRGR